jgi:hypothetical protein
MFSKNNGKLINSVKVKKNELLSVLQENLTKHKDDVLDGLELRREEMKEYFTAKLEKMDSNNKYNPKENINFRMPVDSSKDYEKAIRMIEMTQDEIIELDENQFDKLVMDNWEWKEQLALTSQMYGKSI